jgi:GNAT superfamily N-acetyltransferase
MTPIDLSASELPVAIQQNMIDYMALFAGLPGMVLDATDQTFWFVSKAPGPGHGIFRTRWEEKGVEERIDALLAKIGQHIDKIDWQVYPGDLPVNLGKRLEARGMQGGPGGNWLWCDLEDLPPALLMPPGFHIERVCDDRMMEDWLRASLAGFGGRDVIGSFEAAYAEMASFYDAYARHGYGLDAFSFHYTGYLDNIPVTSGTLLDSGGTAAIYDVSTPPAYRRHGFGGALCRALMDEIRHKGYRETWIWSSDIARSVYQKLGFIDADFGIRFYVWNK